MILPAEPLLFTPLYKEKIWGNGRIRTHLGRPLPAGSKIGESWEISDCGADQSIIASGPLSGMTLSRVADEAHDTLIGPADQAGGFPLLCKFIDAADRLSVQVHPSDNDARLNGWGTRGKAECWFVVDAGPSAHCIAGFNRDTTREEIRSALAEGSLATLLASVPISRGDVLLIPAGTVHAILGDSLLYEVEEMSDTTLRLYDWGRVDATGKPRALHIRDALAVVDTVAAGNRPLPPVTFETAGCRHSYRTACRHFAIEQYSFYRDAEIAVPGRRSFRIVTVVGGGLHLRYSGGKADLPLGCTALLPAIMGEVHAVGSAGSDILVSWVPDLAEEIVMPLRKQGVSLEAVRALGGFGTRNDLSACMEACGR